MVKSAARVLALLELFDATRRPLRVSEIAERLDMPQSSTSMLLMTLVQAGYMEHDADARVFCPSARVSFLGNWVTQPQGQGEGLQDLMRRLSKVTGESILLGRQNGIRMQYLSIIDSAHALRFSPTPGTLRPLHRTAIGIMLLSELPDEQIGLMLRRWNAERPKGEAAARTGPLMQSVAFAREHGYFESASLATSGAGVIATLIPTPLRGRRLGIGIGAPNERLHLRRRELVPVLMDLVGGKLS